MQNTQDVQSATLALASALQKQAPDFGRPDIGIILGTGLGDSLVIGKKASVSFSDLPSFPTALANSHKGNFILGELGGKSVIVQQGRCHLYDGYSPAQICMGVRVMQGLGTRTLIITNAAGALNPLFKAGSLMCMADIINFTGCTPLSGPNNDSWGERFPDMSCPFSPELRDLAERCALNLAIPLEKGVYIAVHGPEMETAAETRMYRQWGADAVGMSSSLEIIAARHLGMSVLGFSVLTNKNLPDCMEPAPIDMVIARARESGKKLALLLEAICGNL